MSDHLPCPSCRRTLPMCAHWLHRDPFDRLLVAQASVEGSTLFVADAALTRYGRFVRMA